MTKKKVVFVTGGSGGIGESICLKLIKSGFNVAIGYKTNKKTADNLTKKIMVEKRNVSCDKKKLE